jgi:hypothetical protein
VDGEAIVLSTRYDLKIVSFHRRSPWMVVPRR